MTHGNTDRSIRRLHGALAFAAALLVLACTAESAERVVLGEYFTELY